MMDQAGLAARLATAPRIARPAAARDRLESWNSGLDPAGPLARLVTTPAVAALLGAVADHSPYLWRLATADPSRLDAILRDDPLVHLAACLDKADACCAAPASSVVDVMRALRQAKADTALMVALADLGGVWTVEEVTEALTRFADGAVRIGLRFLLREAHRSGTLRLADPDDPEADCGLVVLGLGKQGAGELNYSSDIDIVVIFDPASPALAPGTVPQTLFVRMTQALARLLSERTPDGYVLRVDLRLRPDPGSTAVALGLSSAFSYYERHGQNWERAALIKARSVAGERRLGETFLRDLAPFIWRKYFDYAAIADVHAMKRQIHVVRGHASVAVAGHDVKLGRGGIREIEFFVQTQQLIFGGRRPRLRGARTLDMLRELHRDGWVDADAVAALSDAYRFLRTVEHRLQMVNDEQTQRLPADPETLEAFAGFAGFPDAASFAATFTAHARAVEAYYARLFENAPDLATGDGNLVFTGVEDDPETVSTLTRLGFDRPAAAIETVRGWHFGRRAAVQGSRAREVLTELVPRLLAAFARSGDPDGALAAFDSMLGRMPAAVELLSMLRANAALLDLFGDVLGAAPRLAATIAVRPHVLDAAIDPANLQSTVDPAQLSARIDRVLDTTLPIEDFLDRMRDLAQEELFLIGARLLSGADTPQRAAEAYSDFAALVVRAALAHCEATFRQAHGTVPGGACVVLAMGKLGSREMTASSDLDLILIYDSPLDGPASDGPRPLDAARYYARLTQRVIVALTAATRRGRLYDVDMRLRPSGRQGPVATRLSSFAQYQSGEAQMWEHMALTRARVIAGDPHLAKRVEATVEAVVMARRDPVTVRAHVAAMRALVAREKGDAAMWNLKQAQGGSLDLEFIAQSLVLSQAADHPSINRQATRAILDEAIGLGLVQAEAGARLVEAHRFYTNLSQVIRLTLGDGLEPEAVSAGVRRRIVAAADLPDFSTLEANLRITQKCVRATFRSLVGDPDAASA